MSPPRPDPVEPDDDDDSEGWKHDDPTERNPRQRRVAELREQAESMAHTYGLMKLLWEQIQRDWRETR